MVPAENSRERSLTFLDFYLDPECNPEYGKWKDFVVISYENQPMNENQWYCGVTIPGPFICSCSCTGVKVRFYSDVRNNFPGFRAVWTDIPGQYHQ